MSVRVCVSMMSVRESENMSVSVRGWELLLLSLLSPLPSFSPTFLALDSGTFHGDGGVRPGKPCDSVQRPWLQMVLWKVLDCTL